jgi:hypothetical protein
LILNNPLWIHAEVQLRSRESFFEERWQVWRHIVFCCKGDVHYLLGISAIKEVGPDHSVKGCYEDFVVQIDLVKLLDCQGATAEDFEQFGDIGFFEILVGLAFDNLVNSVVCDHAISCRTELLKSAGNWQNQALNRINFI